MNKDSLAYALGHVDTRYILEADPLESETTCKRTPHKWGMIVACLILSILLVAVVAVASGILDPLASYVQGEDDEVYLKEILGETKTVSGEKVQLRLEGAIADDDTCHMVVSMIGLTGWEQLRLNKADIYSELEIYGLTEDGERVKGSVSGSTYMNEGRSTKSLFQDASQTRIIAYSPCAGMSNIEAVCVHFEGLTLEVKLEDYITQRHRLMPKTENGEAITDVHISRMGFAFIHVIPEGSEHPKGTEAYDVRLIRTDGSVLTVEEMRAIGRRWSNMFISATETKILGTWGPMPAIALIELNDYCGLQIDGENYYYAPE